MMLLCKKKVQPVNGRTGEWFAVVSFAEASGQALTWLFHLVAADHC
jgi:hypothetical protein